MADYDQTDVGQLNSRPSQTLKPPESSTLLAPLTPNTQHSTQPVLLVTQPHNEWYNITLISRVKRAFRSVASMQVIKYEVTSLMNSAPSVITLS